MLYIISKTYNKNYICNRAQQHLNKECISIIHNKWKTKYNVSPNEYVSLSAYYWPDPKDKNADYIKKNIINPDKYEYSDRKFLDEILQILHYLSLAYLLTSDSNYADQGARYIKTFFLDSKTYMIPRLIYSGIRPKADNKFTTHGCIIDTSGFWILGDFTKTLLENSTEKQKNRHVNQMLLWYKNLSDWFIYSDYGIKNASRKNNWLTSYYLQLISYLYYAEDTNESKQTFENNFEKILCSQIDKDGKQQNELSRNYPIHYTNYNLHLLSKLAILGSRYNIDVWNYKDKDGNGNLYSAMLYAAKNIKNKQIISELCPHYNLTWLKIASNIYNDDIFKELSDKYENTPEYCLDNFLFLV